MAYTKLFVHSSQTASYAKYRPTYPATLFTAISDFMGGSQKDIAIDVATGSGQAIHGLASLFKQVIGVDVSEQQLQNATKNYANVDYKCGDAHHLPFPDSSVDLVTFAQV